VEGRAFRVAQEDEPTPGLIRPFLQCRSAAIFPSVRNVLGPGLGAWLTGRRYGVAAPEMLAGIRIPAVEEPARRSVAARHPGDHDAIRYQRGDYAGVAFLVVSKLLSPDLLASLHIKRDDVPVDRLAKQFAIIDGRSPAHDDAGLTNPRRPPLIFDRCPPDLLPSCNVEGERPVSVHHVHDVVVDRRLRQLAGVVAEARAPDRYQSLDVRIVDLGQRAVLVEMIAHSEGGVVLAVFAVIDQLLRRLGT